VSGRSVLIVEDEHIIRSTLREFLAGEGYAVSDAGTMSDALALAKREQLTQVALVRLARVRR